MRNKDSNELFRYTRSSWTQHTFGSSGKFLCRSVVGPKVLQAEQVEYALNNFLTFTGNVKLAKINAKLLERYQKARLQTVSLDTVNREIIWVRRLWRLNGIFIQKPTPKPGKVTFQRAFTPDELKRFFDVCHDSMKPLYLLMLASRARLAELVPRDKSKHKPLLKSEVDFERKIMQLRTAKQREGMIRTQAKMRVISLPEWAIEPLKGQIASTEGDYAFPPLVNAACEFNRTIKRAKIAKVNALEQKVTAHSFRYTYATLLAESSGHNAFVLKEAMGHSRLSMTERYCHPAAPTLQISIAGFNA